MEKEIIVVALFAVFLFAAILPRIIQKRKKVETVGCIGINKKLFFLGKRSLFTSFALILVRVFSGRISLFGEPRATVLLEHPDKAVRDFAAETVEEIRIFGCSGNSYGYVFYVMQKA